MSSLPAREGVGGESAMNERNNKLLWMSSLPAREGVGGESAMHERKEKTFVDELSPS